MSCEESKLMYTRLFYGTVQPGKTDEAWRVLNELVPRVRQQKGCAFVQALQIVGITNWQTQADLTAYTDGELSRELFRRITPLLMGVPTVRSYEVKLSL
jgi:quinol monooxygenase YgiN